MQGHTTRQRLNVFFLLLGLVSLLLASCGTNNGTGSQQHVTLTFDSWQGGAAGDAYIAVIHKYMQAHPNVTIHYKVVPSDSMATAYQTEFAGNTPPDLVAMFPGPFKDPFVQAGDLVDLSNQPWVAQLDSNVKGVAAASNDPSKTYMFPTVQDVGGVIYNKQIFQQLGLQVPTNWANFLQVCQKIKAAGIAPLAIGAKDGWPLQQIAYYMTLNSVYSNDASFASDVNTGKATYAGSAAWKQTLQDIQSLQKQGYFNTGFSGTTFADTANLVALGKAAMTINGDFTLQPIRQVAPNAQLGMFPVPYVSAGQTPTAATLVDVTVGIAAKSPHVKEAEQFLQFFAQPDTMAPFLTQRAGLSTLQNVNPSQLDPAQQAIMPAVKAKSANLVGEGISTGVSTALIPDLQALLTGSMTAAQVLQDLDKNNH